MFQEKLYVFGGSSNDPDAGGDLDAVQVYDPILDSWERLPEDLPTNRSWSAAAAGGDGIHVFGGFDIGNNRMDVHERVR